MHWRIEVGVGGKILPEKASYERNGRVGDLARYV
jgi:hypothetical protein